MDIQASIEQVAGILFRDDFSFDTHSDGRSYRLRFGTAGVFVTFMPWAEDAVWIKVHAPVVQDLEPESPGYADALNRLNELNDDHPFVKFRLTPDTLIAEADLVGDGLSAPALSHVVRMVGWAADALGDELAERLGGSTYEAKLEEWAEHDSPDG